MDNFLEKELKEAGFNVTPIIPNLLLVENYLTDEELNTILGIINNTPEPEWFIEYTANLKRFCLEKFGRDDVENLVSEGKFEITQGWQDKNFNISSYPIYKQIHSKLDSIVSKADTSLHLSGFATIQRMQFGVELKSHTDQHTDPSIQYAAILYLNDDYVDGELIFKNNDLQLRPKPGSLLIFPGNEEFEHGVKHVGEGPIRYVLVGFIKITDFYKNNKY
jgi:hypothetical protein